MPNRRRFRVPNAGVIVAERALETDELSSPRRRTCALFLTGRPTPKRCAFSFRET